MKLVNLSENNSVLNNYMLQLRDINIQKDRRLFRENLQRVGAIFGYEISRTFSYTAKDVVTPLGIAKVSTSDQKVVIASILRAGLPIHEGLLRCFSNAESAFVAAYRKYDRVDDYHISIEYSSTINLDGKTLLLADTLLATGASLELSYNKLCEDSEPALTHFVCPIASCYAVEHLMKNIRSDNVTLWVAAVDEELTTQSYIVPGLGDAGDLAFGEKF